MNPEDFYLWASSGDREHAGGGADPGQPSRRDEGPAPLEDDLETEKAQLDLAKQDRSHFDYFVSKYHQRIFNYVFRSTRDHDLAADVANETFVRAWENLDAYEWRGHRFGSWLYRIAGNVVKRRMRQRGSLRETSFVAGLHDPLDARSPDRIHGRERDLELTWRCVGQLPWEQRQVLVLHLWEDLSVRQIAEVTGTPQGTVASHLRRGRVKVAERMARDDVWPLLTETTRIAVRDVLRKDRKMRLVDGAEENGSPKGKQD